MPQTAHELDLCLAQEILDGSFAPSRDASRRRERDLRWIVGLLGFRGVNVTVRDVEAALLGQPGRFRPEHPETRWIRGFRAAIDELDRRAELAQTPDGPGLVELHDVLTEGFSKRDVTLRRELPWERVAGIDYIVGEELSRSLERFAPQWALEAEGSEEDVSEAHPLRISAALCRQFVRLSPFRDFNLPMACMCASWHLVAHGYPPFLVHGGDRATFARVLASSRDVWEQWFAELVYTTHMSA